MLLLLLGLAHAAENPWTALTDTLLFEAADGDLRRASRLYQQLVRNLPADHPARARALFHLGRTHYTLGDNDQARKALLDGARTVTARAECLSLLGQLELEESSVTRTPVRWSFDNDEHGLVHPWEFNERGSIQIERGALAWQSSVDAQHADRLIVGFRAATPRPTVLELEVSADTPTRIQILARDLDGAWTVAYAATTVMPAAKILRVGLGNASLDQVAIEHQRTDGPSRETQLRIDNLRIY